MGGKAWLMALRFELPVTPHPSPTHAHSKLVARCRYSYTAGPKGEDGRSGFGLNITANTRDERLGVELWIPGAGGAGIGCRDPSFHKTCPESDGTTGILT